MINNSLKDNVFGYDLNIISKIDKKTKAIASQLSLNNIKSKSFLFKIDSIRNKFQLSKISKEKLFKKDKQIINNDKFLNLINDVKLMAISTISETELSSEIDDFIYQSNKNKKNDPDQAIKIIKDINSYLRTLDDSDIDTDDLYTMLEKAMDVYLDLYENKELKNLTDEQLTDIRENINVMLDHFRFYPMRPDGEIMEEESEVEVWTKSVLPKYK